MPACKKTPAPEQEKVKQTGNRRHNIVADERIYMLPYQHKHKYFVQGDKAAYPYKRPVPCIDLFITEQANYSRYSNSNAEQKVLQEFIHNYNK